MAPIASLIRRVIRRETWVDTEERKPGEGPTVKMSSRPEIQRPSDGSGPLNHRTYTVRISDPDITPEELVEQFRADPNRFSPTSFAKFEAETESGDMVVGDKYVVRLPGPWDGPVIVTNTDERVLRLETLDDHLEAGWIEFSAKTTEGELEFVIESLASSGDPIFDFLYHEGRIGRLVQTEMWVRVVEAAVDVAGGAQIGPVLVHTTIYEGTDQ